MIYTWPPWTVLRSSCTRAHPEQYLGYDVHMTTRNNTYLGHDVHTWPPGTVLRPWCIRDHLEQYLGHDLHLTTWNNTYAMMLQVTTQNSTYAMHDVQYITRALTWSHLEPSRYMGATFIYKNLLSIAYRLELVPDLGVNLLRGFGIMEEPYPFES
jgi:hypothetical protein